MEKQLQQKYMKERFPKTEFRFILLQNFLEIGDHTVTAEKTGKDLYLKILIGYYCSRSENRQNPSGLHGTCFLQSIKSGRCQWGEKRISWNPGRIRGRIECVKKRRGKNGRSSKDYQSWNMISFVLQAVQTILPVHNGARPDSVWF